MAVSATVQHFLERWTASSQIEQPIIVVGPSNQTAEVITLTAQLIACKTGKACSVCLGCKQAVKLVHPDIFSLQDDESKVTLKEIQAVRTRLNQAAFHNKQLIIFPNAQRLRTDSNNALLKTLEEVSARTRIMLTTPFVGKLLPTLRSRCQIIRLVDATIAAGFSVAQLGILLEEHKRSALNDQELNVIVGALEHWRTSSGTNPLLTRAYLRLRDYYKIRSSGGNEPLAADVLVASVQQFRHTRGNDN